MSDGIDRYDVETMIRDANYRNASAADLDNARASWREDLRDVRRELDEVRDALASLTRTLNARTGHLA